MKIIVMIMGANIMREMRMNHNEDVYHDFFWLCWEPLRNGNDGCLMITEIVDDPNHSDDENHVLCIGWNSTRPPTK